MVQGIVLVQQAVDAGISLRFVVARLSEASLLDSVAVPPEKKNVMEDVDFDRLNDTASPQGILAVCDIPTPGTPLDEVEGWCLVAAGVSDPGNLGTILRSAEASGAAAVVVTTGTVDPFSPKCVRSSAGAGFYVPVYRVNALEEVAHAGFILVGTTSHPGPRVRDLWSEALEGRVAIVLGNESKGLPADSPVEFFLTVPHRGRSESMNVAMAATVITAHIGRSRRGDHGTAN